MAMEIDLSSIPISVGTARMFIGTLDPITLGIHTPEGGEFFPGDWYCQIDFDTGVVQKIGLFYGLNWYQFSYGNQSGGVGKYVRTIGDGVSRSFTIAHNLNTTAVTITCYQLGSPYNQEDVGVSIDGNNSVIVTFEEAPSTDSIQVVVIG